MSSSREKILGRVNAALAPLPKRAVHPDFADKTATMPNLPLGDTTALFKERLKLVNGQSFDDAASLVAWLKAAGHTRGYCDPALWAGLSAAFSDGFKVETSFDRTRVDDYQFGITRSVGAIAETGSIILTDKATSSRLGALAPWIHIAVVSKKQIHPDLVSAVTALGDDPNVIWCTGPSKTADVEGILIQGVHGPGVQIALLEN
ncbi:MAG: LUD domain-containing protein [Nibricoccus sp.]